LPDRDVKPTRAAKGADKTSVGSTILAIGIILSFVNIFILTAGWQNASDEMYWLLAMFGMLLSPGHFMLFSIGWFLSSAKKRRNLASFGWWLFFIGTWFEIFFITLFAPSKMRIICYSSQIHEHWCEPTVDFLALYYIFPAIVMLFGLMLVYLGKKQKNQNP